MVVVGDTDNALVLEPVFQLYAVAPDAVKEVDCPLQMVEEFTVIVGNGFIVIVPLFVTEQPPNV